MAAEALSAAAELLRDSHDHHFQVVHGYLNGKETEPNQLWLSVGYFVCGRGTCSKIKPWKNEEQLDKLLIDTERKEAPVV